MSEYQYPDRNDELLADVVATESKRRTKAPKLTLLFRKKDACTASSNTCAPTQQKSKPSLKKKMRNKFIFNAKVAHLDLSTYWAASESLALQRVLPFVFSTKKNKIKSADIGCGEGRLLGMLAEYSNTVIGVEPSDERFELAAQVAQTLPNATVVNGTADALPSASFDVVLCSHVIQHLCAEEQEKLAKNVLRILKPGGICVLTTTFTKGKQSKYVTESWKDGKRVREIVDAATCNAAYGKNDIIPARIFSRKDLLSYFDGCTVVAFGCYHFTCVKNARFDALFNRIGDLGRAKDAYYVLKKPLNN